MNELAEFDLDGPGDAAPFAWRQTERANETLVRDDGHARTWQRRQPFTRARVVATVNDVDPSESDGVSVVLRGIPDLRPKKSPGQPDDAKVDDEQLGRGATAT